jgi:isopenicillin N synthase-like dioxygenase
MAVTSTPGGQSVSQSMKSEAIKAQEYLQQRMNSKTATTTFSTIPIIDLTRSFSSSLEDRQSVANQIHEACTKVGFFYITNHGISKDICDAALSLAARFFHDLPQESKDEIHMKKSDQFRGYEPASFSSVIGDPTEKETKEAFNWGYEAGLDPTGGDGAYVELDGSTKGSPNQWPSESELPGFYKGIAQYYGEVHQPTAALLDLPS